MKTRPDPTIEPEKSDQIIIFVILGDPIHATAWFSSRDSCLRLSCGRSLPCWIDAFSSESLCGFPLSLSCCHHSLHILPSATAFKLMFAVHFRMNCLKGLEGPEVAASCLNNRALHQFATNPLLQHLFIYVAFIATANTIPANDPP